MAEYSLTMNATNNSTSTDYVFVELGAGSGVQFKVKRVRVGYSDGTATVGVDNHFRITLYRWDTSTAGSSIAGTIIKKNPFAPNALTTAKIKNGATNLALGTTNVEILDIVGTNARAMWEWVANDEDEYWWSKSGTAGFFAVVIATPSSGQKFQVSVVWSE
jgi:hypothetical protein